MTGVNFARAIVFAAAMLIVESGGSAQAQQAIKPGGVLTGELNILRSRDKAGKRINTYQVVSAPRRLPPPSGLCDLTTGPETFQIVANEAQTAQLHSLVGKEVSLVVSEVACAVEKNQWSEAVVTKWRLVTK